MALTKLSTDVIDLSGNTTALTIPSGTTSNINLDAVDWLVVAGGAGGGSNGGGGGAGGLRTSYGSTAPGTTGTIESALSLTHSVAYTATVGAGGAALIMAAGYQLQGNAGGASSLSGTGITTITTDGKQTECKGIMYENLTGLLVEAIKEQNKRIEHLEQCIATLQAEKSISTEL